MTTIELTVLLDQAIRVHPKAVNNPTRTNIIADVVERKEAFVTATGALATWGAPASTGRRPENTYIVKHGAAGKNVDWTSPNSHPISVEVFDALWQDACARLARKDKLYVMDRAVGADASYALATHVVTDRALTALFCDTMFRPALPSLRGTQVTKQSREDTNGIATLPDRDRGARNDTIDQPFTLFVLPFEQAQSPAPTPIVIAMDLDRKLGLILGTSYSGTVKKFLFTVMNYLLPEKGILPLHSSATESSTGDVVVMLGLSGTGKTTLSAEPDRLLIGDDELD